MIPKRIRNRINFEPVLARSIHQTRRLSLMRLKSKQLADGLNAEFIANNAAATTLLAFATEGGKAIVRERCN
jgi:hypothetical protein